MKSLLIKGIAAAINLLTLAGMWLLLPLGPVAATIISGDRSYVARYRQGLRASIGHLRGMARGRPVARAVERWLADSRAGESTGVSGQCTHCGQCCLDKSCIFLRFDAQGHSRCQIYQRPFWSLLPCGEYPLSSEEIAQYACPSFTAGARRVIPIHQAPADVRPAGEEVPQTM